METRWIKRISFILAAAMLLTLLPVSALAEEAVPYQNTPAPVIDTPADTPAEEHVVALTAADGGRVSGGGVYADGEEVTVTAHPSDDYEFTGWYDDARLISLAPVYTFTASQSVSYQAAFDIAKETPFALTVEGTENYTITDENGETMPPSSIPANTQVTLTAPHENFLYWVNSSRNILSTEPTYTFTMVRNTTVTAVYAASAPSVSRVVFRNGYAQIMDDITDGKVSSLPAGPTKMGYTFDYWYYVKGNEEVTLNKDTLQDFVDGLDDAPATRIEVLPHYSENGAQYTINISYKNADDVELETQPDPKTQTVKVGDKTNTGDAPATIGDLTFSYWKELVGEDSRIVSYDSNYSVLRAQSCTVDLVAVYGASEDAAPLVNITQTYASMSGAKYVVSNTMQYYLPEGYELVQAGIEYYTSTNETVRRSIDSNTTRRGLFTFNARLSSPSTTLNARGFIIYKNEAGKVQEQYSGWVSKSYYDLSGTASVKQNEQGTVTVAPATIQAPAASATNTPEVTAVIPEGVKLTMEENTSASSAPVSLNVIVEKEPVPENVDIPSAAQQTTNFQVEIKGVAADNAQPIVVCLKKALAANLTGVKAYHINAQNNQPEEMEAGESKSLTEPETFFYDADTGDLYICVNHFSDFTFTYKTDAIKFPNVDNYLYRVGNKNAINLSSLFDTTNVSVKSLACEALSATIDNVATITGVTSIDFDDAFTGVVRLTATLTNGDTITLPLEVVDATNATSAASATAQNVCLLNNITIGNQTISVSNGYSFYGNGFTVTTRSNGEALNSGGMSTGYFEVIGGTMDNVQLDCAIYPSAFLYKTSGVEYVQQSSNKTSTNGDKNYYGYQYSGVVVSGGGVISNCYIKGARNNILATGSATVVNTTCDRGSLSNIHMSGTDDNTVILDNCTTIQYISDSFEGNKKVEGLGVLVGEEDSVSNPKLVIRNSLNQYNWVCSGDADQVTSSNVAKTIISSALNQSKYIHKFGGKDYVNMGIMFINTKTANIQDNRENNGGYEHSQINVMSGVKGQVYTLLAGNGDVVLGNSDYRFTDYRNNEYVPVYKVSNLPTTEPDGDGAKCWYDGGKIHIVFPLGMTYSFDVFDYIFFDRYKSEQISADVSCTGGSVNGGTISFTTSGDKEIVITVSESGKYNADGSKTGDFQYSIFVPVTVLTPDVSWRPAEILVNTSANTSGVIIQKNTDTPYWYDILDGLTIYDYDREGNKLTVLDASNPDSKRTFVSKISKVDPSGDILSTKENFASNGTITITLNDGRVLKMTTKRTTGSNNPASGTKSAVIKKDSSGSTLYYVTTSKAGWSNNSGTGIGKKITAETFTWVSEIFDYTFIGNSGSEVKSESKHYMSTGLYSGVFYQPTYGTTAPSTSPNPQITKTIHFDPRGGNCGQSVAYKTSTQATVTLPTPIKQGLDFKGWFTAPVGGTRIGGAGDTVTPNNDTMPGTDVTLYAQWIAPFTVTYRVNGGTALDQDTFVCVSGSEIQLPTTSQTTQWFTGWYVGEERIGGAGDTYYVPEHDVTIIAGWSPKYAVAYDANGGTLDDAYSIANPLENNQVFVGAIYEGNELALPLPTNGTRTFEGWFTEKTDGTRIGDAGDGYIPEESITLYAQWSDNIPVIYNDKTPDETTQKVMYDRLTPLTLPSPTWPGHQFNGWYTLETGGTRVGGAGDSYVPAKATTLYAQWTAYTVTYDANSGSVSPASASAGEDGTVTLPTPTRTGYTFNGWYTETSGGSKIGNGGTSYTPTANITLHAQWTINSYTVTITTSNSSTKVTANDTTVSSGSFLVPYNSVVKVVLSYSENDSRTFTVKQGNTNVTRYSDEACTTDPTTTSTAEGTYYFKMPAGDVTISSSSEAPFCLPSGTLITLADGTQKPVEAITMEDSVLAFNHETGELEPASIIFIEDDSVSQYNVINLNFSDGTVSRLIYEHGYFDLDEMQYVYITEANCRDYIGHHFAKITEGETGYEVESVELVDAYINEETTGCYSFPSAYHLNVIADGLLSMPGGIEGMFNIFAYDEDLKYDTDAMARDIETYGLLTYDDFADVISYEEYAMYPAPYLGVSLGKGLMTQEQLSDLIERYVAAKR